jgi:hypothetical protein
LLDYSTFTSTYILFNILLIPLGECCLPSSRLLKEVTFYEKEASEAVKTIEKTRNTEGKDEYDVRQSVSVHVDPTRDLLQVRHCGAKY